MSDLVVKSSQAYRWLGAGAFTLGVGAALAAGCGVAHADDAGKGANSSHSTTGPTAKSKTDSATAKAKRTAVTPKKETFQRHSEPSRAFHALTADLHHLASAATNVTRVAQPSSSVLHPAPGASAQALGERFTPNVAVSVFGVSLIHSGSATASSGAFSSAIAFGPNSAAYAVGGVGNLALAAGSNSSAGAGGKDGLGNDGKGNFDTAVDIGNNTGGLNGAAATLGDHNTAIDIGNNTGFVLGALAFDGNHNTSIDIGNNSGSASGAGAFEGDRNTAITLGNNTNSGLSETFGGGAQAGQGNRNTAFQLGSNNGDGAVPPFGYGPIAGGANGTTGNDDFAAIIGDNGTALAGIGFDHDSAIAVGNDLTALANTADYVGTLRWFNL
jgi:hypothetical protein